MNNNSDIEGDDQFRTSGPDQGIDAGESRVGERPAGHQRAMRSPSAGGRRRLLVISYYYPPMGFGGVYRIAKFTKYLPQFGWDPTVLTVGEVGYFTHDYSLLEEVLEAGVSIERTRTLDPLRLFKRKGTIPITGDRSHRFLRGVSHTFLQPDNKIGWRRYALKRAAELLEGGGFDAILATAPPFTDFLIGVELQQRYGLPLVIDYRDPWMDNQSLFYATPLHRGYAVKMEETVLKNADSVVVGNRRIKEKLIARYPFLTHGNVHIIPSGYDPYDFRLAARYPVPRGHRMRVTYSGLFSGGRSPKFMFQALAKIFAKHPETRDEIELCFVGPFPEPLRKLATKLGVANSLVAPGYAEHHQSIRYLVASDVLWLTHYDPAITPGKVYEYLGTRKPILALVPPGGVRQILESYDRAACVDPEDVEGIADALYDLYRQWSAGTLTPSRQDIAGEYEQRHLVEQLARVLAYSLKI